MFPEIHTSRLHLRKIRPEDKAAIFEGLSHPAVIRYYGISYESPEEVEEQMRWYRNLEKSESGIWWGICLKDNFSLIGACGFNEWHKEHRRIELGYWLLPNFWQQGIMSEAIPEIMSYAFQVLDIHRIEAVVESENEESKKLLQKLGFAFEGTHKDCEIKNNRFISLDYFAAIQ
jgi:ribosomal-protein-alanine N-acetyltransferase